MTTHRAQASLLAVYGVFTAMCLSACSAGIDVGQVTGTGAGTGTGTGGGVDAGLEGNPTVLNLGTAVVSTTTTQTAVVSNVSGAEIDGITATVSGNASTWFGVSGVPASLAAGAQVTVTVSFTPLTAAGQVEVSLNISAAGFAPVTLALTGNAVATALQLDPTTLDFGYVPLTTTAIACTTISNVANVTDTISGVQDFQTVGNAYRLATTDNATSPNPISFPIVLAPGTSAKVCFDFTPPIIQEYDGQVTLLTNDPSGTNPVVGLAGWGGGPQISCTPLTLDFGPIADGTASTLQVLCTNTGTAIPPTNLMLGPLTSSSSAFSAQLASPVSDGGLESGQSATIDVTYQPSGNGSDTGTLLIPSNAGQGQPVSISLSGTGTVLEVEPSTLNFGYVQLDTSVVECTTITDGEAVSVTISGIADFASADGFTVDSANDAGQEVPINEFPIVIAAGGSAEVCFALYPGIAMDYNGQATLLTNDPSGVNPVISLIGWGGGPQISCTPTSLDFDSADAGRFGQTLQVVCSNTGTAIPTTGLTIASLTSSSSAFSAQLASVVSDGGLEPGQSATINVGYTPSGSGNDVGTLQIDNNGGQGQPVSIPLSGSGS